MTPPRSALPATGRLGPLRVLVAVALGALTLGLYAANVAEFHFLSDDAFISYRYALNFVRGHGLVWNVGEPPVEGYSNFLWVWVAVLALSFDIAPEKVSVALTVAAGAAILVLLFLFSGRRRGYLNPLSAIAPLCLATNRTFAAWSTSGLATQAFSFGVLASALLFLRERRRSSGAPAVSALAFAVTTLVRPEGILFAFGAGCLFLWDVAVARKRDLRALLIWVGAYFAIVGTHALWRHSHYGFWFPNTYYAKTSGELQWVAGIDYLRLFLHEYGLLWFLPIALVPAVLRRRAEDFLFLLFLLLFAIYVVWVGGDFMEFRFLNVALPYLYWTLVEGLGVFAGLITGPRPIQELLHARVGLSRYLPKAWMPGMSHLFKALAGVALMLLVVVTYRTSLRTDEEVWDRGLVNDVRKNMRGYSERRTLEGEALRGFVERGLLPADLRIAVGGAGALPYYSELYTVDFLGLNDVVIAHEAPVKLGLAGHRHEARPDYLREKGVEVIDATNGLVRVGDPANFPRTAERYCFTGDLVCYEVQEGVYLLFGTPLDEALLAQRFGHLERVY